jgi:hypothetical protein
MDFLTFWGLILLTFLIVSVGTIFLSYWIPKKMGYRKVGVIISRTLMVVAVIGILTIVFSDKLFFKSDVNEILGRHNIKLKDDFKIISNSSGGLMDYYHIFELSISQADKEEIIGKIKASKDFVVDTKNSFYLPDKTDRYSNTTIVANYENDSHFKHETFQTFEQGTAPTHEIIAVDKTSNRLTFEQVID